MKNNALHIVSFDVPFPADYGGVIDVFYKIKALHGLGCKIHLHCFDYGRGQPSELKKYCETVNYYERAMGLRDISFRLPFILASRRADLLLQHLKNADAPILFDGVHSSYYLNHHSIASIPKIVRVHNIEHDYYTQMFRNETSLLKKIFFKREAKLLKKYEYNLKTAQAFAALSAEDNAFFMSVYPDALHKFIPPFHQYNEVMSFPGSGSYCLYHGNLSHPENRQAALFLINNVFNNLDIPLIIAGKNPQKDILAACDLHSNCTLIANPTEAKMDELIAGAHIHVLPTFQQSGVKLKLLSALFRGRHIIVNASMLHGTGLDNDICRVAETSEQFIAAISELITTPFTVANIHERSGYLSMYENQKNARELLELVEQARINFSAI